MSGLSAGHGMSFPLQHNLGDDTAYSMMHVPPQQAPKGAVRQQPGAEAGLAPPAVPTPVPGPPAAPWGGIAFMPTPAWGPHYAYPPPPPPISEQRLAEIIERIVTAMLERERTTLPPTLVRATRAGSTPTLAPDAAHDVRIAASGTGDDVQAPAVGASRGLAAGVVVAIVFGAIALLIFGVIVLVVVARLADPLGAVQEAADAAAERGMDRALSRGLGAVEGPLRLRSRARAAGRRIMGEPAQARSSGPARWLREALEEVSAQE
jgi:hypothetical protein